MDKDTKLIVYSILGFMIVLLSITLCYICYSYSTQDNTIDIENDRIVVDYYGFDDRIDITNINEIELINELPNGGKYGSGIEDNKHIAGDARFETIGKCKAYIKHI